MAGDNSCNTRVIALIMEDLSVIQHGPSRSRGSGRGSAGGSALEHIASLKSLGPRELAALVNSGLLVKSWASRKLGPRERWVLELLENSGSSRTQGLRKLRNPEDSGSFPSLAPRRLCALENPWPWSTFLPWEVWTLENSRPSRMLDSSWSLGPRETSALETVGPSSTLSLRDFWTLSSESQGLRKLCNAHNLGIAKYRPC